jgi:hypothetical protein
MPDPLVDVIAEAIAKFECENGIGGPDEQDAYYMEQGAAVAAAVRARLLADDVVQAAARTSSTGRGDSPAYQRRCREILTAALAQATHGDTSR